MHTYYGFCFFTNFFGTNLRLTEIQSLAGIEQLKDLKKIQKKREKMALEFHKITLKYKNYIESYFPPSEIRSAWYRFYFFVRPNIKNKKLIRFKIIKELKKMNIKCFTGTCPEIYLEKSFKNLKNFKHKRLKNCKTLGETSIALDVNHTISSYQHKKDLDKIDKTLKKILIF